MIAQRHLAGLCLIVIALTLTGCIGGTAAQPVAEAALTRPTHTVIAGQACAPGSSAAGEAAAYALAGTPLSPSCEELTATPSPAPVHTVTTTPTSSVTPRPTATRTATLLPSPTTTPSPTVTPTATQTPTATAAPTATPLAEMVRIAVIGDYGLANAAEGEVAALVKTWNPDAVVTLGDNNYPFGSPETIDGNIGQYYAEFIYPYRGAFGPGAESNRFFPALGNHDWIDLRAQAYFDYFELPGNERYYEVRLGPVGVFVLDSQPDEPDGITADSTQGRWLQSAMAASDAPWKLIVMHHPPYSSGPHAPVQALRWPFAEWGATAVLAGHDHIYERIERDGILYFVNGLGGTIKYDIGSPVEGSQVRYNDDFGAMLIEASRDQIAFTFVTRAGQVIDTRTIGP